MLPLQIISMAYRDGWTKAHVQNLGHDPGSKPPESPWSQTLRYGDLTARGMAGGLAGVKDEDAARGLGP